MSISSHLPRSSTAGVTLVPCDSAARMTGPFLLPGDIDEGDWIELGQLGAYGACLRTRFNGFYPDRFVELETPFDEEPGVSVPAAAE